MTRVSKSNREAATPIRPRAAARRRPRGSLSADEILDAAQELIEQHGIRELSMPAVAKQLQSGVTSIYWYFSSKDELLAALTERVARQLYHRLPAIGDRDWKEELFDYFMTFRQIMEDTPVCREVFAYRPYVFIRTHARGTMLTRLEDGLALLVRAGMDAPDAVRAFRICSDYTRGFVLLKQGLATEDGGDGGASAGRTADGRAADGLVVDPAVYCTIHAGGGIDTIMSLHDEDFVLGLRLLIDSIETHLISSPPAKGPAAGRGRALSRSR